METLDSELLGPSEPAGDAWLRAERAADLYRYARNNPTRRQLLADRWMRPAIVVLEPVAVAGAIIAFALPGPSREALQLDTSVVFLIILVLTAVWAFTTDRFSFTGTPNIRTALPTGQWPQIRQQLTGRTPLDRSHHDVIIELAHQQRRSQQGQIVFFAVYLPLIVLLQINSRHVETWVLLVLGVALLGTVLVFYAISDRQLARFLRHNTTPAGTT